MANMASMSRGRERGREGEEEVLCPFLGEGVEVVVVVHSLQADSFSMRGYLRASHTTMSM